MQIEDKTINVIGLAEIHAFLAARHKLGGDNFTLSMLNAWADAAEFQLAEGNPATIEIAPWEAVSGHTETFTVSDAGIDTAMVEVEESPGATYLMNPHTGSVDTSDNWEAEGYTTENALLIEVVENESGDWVEAMAGVAL